MKRLRNQVWWGILLALALASCSGDLATTGEAPEGSPTASATPAREAETPAEDFEGEHSDPAVVDLMDDLVSREPGRAAAALETVVESGDMRFIAVLIEVMRAAEIGLVSGSRYQAYIQALESLSGQAFGADWPAWVEWYGATDLTPPPGFTGWKGRLLSLIDPRFGDFLSEDAPSSIRVEEIQWGGVLVDGIPALDNPAVIDAGEAEYLLPQEPVFGISIHGESRAYPLRILDWHEMANDVVGGVPLSLAYCTLCGAGIAFDGRASDGNTYSFGSSGFLFRSNKLMYDRQTRTLWNQLTGEPVLGELVGSDLTLDLLPVVLTTWQDWWDQHPETTVLSLETGHQRLYSPGAAYGGYFASEGTMFPVWLRSDILETKDRIYALRVDGAAKAYPVERLAEEMVVNDFVGDSPVVVIAQRGSVTVNGESIRSGPVTYDAGGEVRAYSRGEEEFSAGLYLDEVLDSEGQVWQVTEEALIGPAGDSLPRLNGHLAYWFGWFSFFPHTEVYGEN